VLRRRPKTEDIDEEDSAAETVSSRGVDDDCGGERTSSVKQRVAGIILHIT